MTITTTYHVVILKSNGDIVESTTNSKGEFYNEISAIKSAKAHVTLRKEPAAVVILHGEVLFAIPESIKKDQDFIKKAIAKAKPGPRPTSVLPKPKTPAVNLPPELASFPVTAAAITKTSHAVKKEGVVIPETKPKIKACDIEALESSCITFSLSRCVPFDQAQKIMESNRDQITTLASQIAQNKLNRYEAVQALISNMQGNCPMTSTNSKETKATQPEIDINTPLDLTKIMRGHKKEKFAKTRVRKDIGNDEDLDKLDQKSLPDGIMIFTTKETDDAVNGILAQSMGLDPRNLLNMHFPSLIPGFDFRVSVPLTRPTIKTPRWRAMGERIQNPGLFVQRVKEQFKDETKVMVIIAQGIDLE